MEAPSVLLSRTRRFCLSLKAQSRISASLSKDRELSNLHVLLYLSCCSFRFQSCTSFEATLSRKPFGLRFCFSLNSSTFAPSLCPDGVSTEVSIGSYTFP